MASVRQRGCAPPQATRPLCAGYHQGDDPLPTPPVTKWVTDFAAEGRNNSDMLIAAVDWANAQPLTDGALVAGGFLQAVGHARLGGC